MPLTRKQEPQLWDDESGQPAPFTPEEVDARLEAANDRMEQENLAASARLKEINELLSREEAIVANLHTALRESYEEMETIHARMSALNVPPFAPRGRAKPATKPPRRTSVVP